MANLPRPPRAPVAGLRHKVIPGTGGQPGLLHSLTRPSDGAGNAAGRSNSQYQSILAGLVRMHADAGMPPPAQYLEFLQNSGTPGQIIAQVEDGRLPMDPRSRAMRAWQMGLDPGLVWFRADSAGKTKFQGRARDGITYAAAHPKMARDAAQTGTEQMYPLIVPYNLLGLHPGPDVNYLDFEGFPLQASGRPAERAQILRAIEDHRRMESGRPPSRPGFGSLTSRGFQWRSPYDAPGWGHIEDPDTGLKQALFDSGYAGSLVRDEAALSAAITEPERLRHKSLSALAPELSDHPEAGLFWSLAPLLLAPALEEQ